MKAKLNAVHYVRTNIIRKIATIAAYAGVIAVSYALFDRLFSFRKIW